MIPIYEQGSGKGIGHNLNSFLGRFDEICRDHLQEGRAKAFALILYDFRDHAIRTILRDQGVFARLDRLAGKEVSIFYLHAPTQIAVNRFNTVLLRELNFKDEVQLPCVVFFKLSRDGFHDIAVAQLDSADLIHAFPEIYSMIEDYVRDVSRTDWSKFKFIKWVTSASKFVSLEVLRGAIEHAVEYLF